MILKNTKNENNLKSALLEVANILRGSAVDRTYWKDIISLQTPYR